MFNPKTVQEEWVKGVDPQEGSGRREDIGHGSLARQIPDWHDVGAGGIIEKLGSIGRFGEKIMIR